LAPYRTVKTRQNGRSLVSTKIEKIKKKRNRYLKKYRRTKNKDYLIMARETTKTLKKEIKIEARRITQLKATSSNTKTFWNLVSNLLGKTRRSEITLESEGKLVTDKKAIGQIARDFFIGKVLRLANLTWEQTH